VKPIVLAHPYFRAREGAVGGRETFHLCVSGKKKPSRGYEVRDYYLVIVALRAVVWWFARVGNNWKPMVVE